MTMITAETLTLWRDVATASTPGLLKGLFRSDDAADQVEQFRETLLTSPSGKCWTVCCPVDDATPIEISALYAAITGNGPTAEANARFFAGARDALLLAVDEIERLRIETSALRIETSAQSARIEYLTALAGEGDE